jgi:hypothetical protein
MSDPKAYWFRAKRYGWGWGLPLTWQGWVVMVVWVGMVIPGSIWLSRTNIPLFAVFMATMVIVLAAICYLKGEPPRWRWGGER